MWSHTLCQGKRGAIGSGVDLDASFWPWGFHEKKFVIAEPFCPCLSRFYLGGGPSERGGGCEESCASLITLTLDAARLDLSRSRGRGYRSWRGRGSGVQGTVTRRVGTAAAAIAFGGWLLLGTGRLGRIPRRGDPLPRLTAPPCIPPARRRRRFQSPAAAASRCKSARLRGTPQR